jgi:hypothetical protein
VWLFPDLQYLIASGVPYTIIHPGGKPQLLLGLQQDTTQLQTPEMIDDAVHPCRMLAVCAASLAPGRTPTCLQCYTCGVCLLLHAICLLVFNSGS